VDGKPFPRLGVPAACAPLNVRLVSRLLYNRALTIMWQLFTRPARNVTTTLQFANSSPYRMASGRSLTQTSTAAIRLSQLGKLLTTELTAYPPSVLSWSTSSGAIVVTG
jgi:hypothetical protein